MSKLFLKKTAFVIGLSALGLTACGKAKIADVSNNTIPITNVSDYVFSDNNSKVYISFNGGDERTEITKYVTNYNNGDIYINEVGLENLFGLSEENVNEEEIKAFDRNEKNNNLASSPDASYLKFVNDYKIIIMKEGSRLYLVNGEARVLNSSVIKLEDGHYSLPFMNIAFDYGYTTIGTSVKGDSLIYSLNSDDAALNGTSVSYLASPDDLTGEETEESIEESIEETVPESIEETSEGTDNEFITLEGMTENESESESAVAESIAETIAEAPVPNTP